MRIGILTFHRSYNYGAFLQCYSLVQQLKKDFPTDRIEVIDYMYDDNLGYKAALGKMPAVERASIQRRNEAIGSVISYLPLSEKKIITKDYQSLYRQIADDYDVIIIGSDAVFNWNGKGLPNAFLPVDTCFKGKLVSYAASAHGMNYRVCEETVLVNARRALRGFDYLAVRDENTDALIKALAPELNTSHTCDPTVLLDLDSLPVDMDALKEKLWKKGISFDRPIVGFMAGDHVGKGMKEVCKDVQLVSVYRNNKYTDVFLDDLNPFEWARVFSLFDATVTTFFHGTMFSLKNDTPTLVVERIGSYQKEYLTKVRDLLIRLGLEEFYLPCNLHTETLLQKVLFKLGISGSTYRRTLNLRVSEYLTEGLPKGYITDHFQDERETYQIFRDYMRFLKERI